jgi:hypothetical protein
LLVCVFNDGFEERPINISGYSVSKLNDKLNAINP